MSKTKLLLMIKTEDRRKFFTHKKNLPMLIEFAKTFHAELDLVRAYEADVLELEDLAHAFCDSRECCQGRFEVVQHLYPQKESNRCRSVVLQNAAFIHDCILKKFLQDGQVVVKDLKKEFSQFQLSPSCISNHLSQVVEKLKFQGVNVTRVKAGVYVAEQK